MTQKILNAGQAIIDGVGKMSIAFRNWTRLVTNNLRIIGIGSPEGSVEAPQYSIFIDEAVPLVPVQYIKMLSNIGGDITKGWVIL